MTLDGDRARLAALVEAQHVTKTEPDGDRWVIRRMVIRTVWHDGDASVLFGAAAG